MGFRTTPRQGQSDTETVNQLLEIVQRFKFGTFTWATPGLFDPLPVTTTLTSATNPSLKGLRVGCPICVTPNGGSLGVGVFVFAWIPAADQLSITMQSNNLISVGAATWSFFSVLL